MMKIDDAIFDAIYIVTDRESPYFGSDANVLAITLSKYEEIAKISVNGIETFVNLDNLVIKEMINEL